MSRGLRNDLSTEIGLMEFSEQEIKELQAILRSKVGDHHPVIKKAMDIEDYLYRDALYKNGQERSGNVWEYPESVNSYVDSLHSFKILMQAKQGDWNKLFQISDIRQFCMQITSNRPPAKKKVREEPSSYTIPAPLRSDGDGSAAKTTKKRGSRSVPPKRKSVGGNKRAAPPVIPAPPFDPTVLPTVEVDFAGAFEEDVGEGAAAIPTMESDIDLGFDFNEDDFGELNDGSGATGPGDGTTNAEAWGNFSASSAAPEGGGSALLSSGPNGGW
ncbi:unnamed protein product, partial [Symbiodinium microadriaticum]